MFRRWMAADGGQIREKSVISGDFLPRVYRKGLHFVSGYGIVGVCERSRRKSLPFSLYFRGYEAPPAGHTVFVNTGAAAEESAF